MKTVLNKFYILAISSMILFGCNSGGNNINGSATQKSLNVQNGTMVTDPNLNGMIPLIYADKGNGMGATCTGTLLDPTTVLTAAHCVIEMPKKKAGITYTAEQLNSPKQINIILSKNLSRPVNINNDDPSLWNVYNVSKIYVHSQAFKGADVADSGAFDIVDLSQINDVAIIKLTKPVAGQYRFATVAENNPTAGTKELIAGYGVDIGEEVITPSLDGDSGVLRSAFSVVENLSNDGSYIDVGGILDRNIGYTRICSGDSGGPDLIPDSNGTGYVITGVHSFGEGEGCGVSGKPSSSLSAAHYYDWINGGYLVNSL